MVTAADVPGVAALSNCQPQPFVFPADRVRFLGEAVAAVAATSEAVALRALDLIEVDYEPLPRILDIESALAKDAGFTAETDDETLLASVRLRYRPWGNGPLAAEDFPPLGHSALWT